MQNPTNQNQIDNSVLLNIIQIFNMIMTNRRSYYDESMWDRLEGRIKRWTYAVMHELLQNQICSVMIYKLLIVIETVQLAYFSVHPVLDSFLFKTDWLGYFRNVIEYFQLNSILNSGGSNLFLVILYLIFSVEILMFILLVFITYRVVKNKRKTSTFQGYALKTFSFYAILINTVISLPYFNIFVTTIYCNDAAPYSNGITCYRDMDFLHIAIGIIGLLFYLFYILLFGLLYVELYPNPNIPFAAPQSKINFYKQILKIALPLYVTVDFGGKLCKAFVALLALYYFILLILRYRTPPIYNQSVQTFTITGEAILFWFALVDCITAFLDLDQVDDIGFFYMISNIPIVAYCYIQILERRKLKLIQTNLKQFKKEWDIEMYVNCLVDLIETRNLPESRLKLEGVLKLHLKSCQKFNDICVCQQLASDNLKEDETPQKQRRWFLLIQQILSESIDRYQKSPRLHLQYAYINQIKLKNKFKALFELMITEENKPNVQEEFSIFRYKNLIEDEMIESDQKNVDSRGVDVNIIVHFQNKFVIFLNSVERSVNLHLEFWRELLEENPDIQKLQSLGSKITNTVEQTNDLFRKLNEMNPNHIKCLEIYGNFLKEIVNDDQEGYRILEKAGYVKRSVQLNRQFLDNDRQKYGENSNTCIITCSGNFNNVGIITNTNNEITRILQFSKSDIISQNCNRLMPKFYSDSHDIFMKNYLETSESKIIGLERVVLALNKSGYLVACTLMIKILPNLDEGIQIVGFLKDIDTNEEKIHYIIFNANNFSILGVSQSVYQNFGIPASLTQVTSSSSNEFTIDTLCPDLVDPNHFDELKNQGMVISIDTTSLKQNYFLGHGDSDDEHSGDDEKLQFDQSQNQNNSVIFSKQGDVFSNGKNVAQEITQTPSSNSNNNMANVERKKINKYRVTKIRVQIIEDSMVGEMRIQIIKFIEVDEGEIIKQQTGHDIERNDDTTNPIKQQIQEQRKDADDNGNEDGNKSDKESNASGDMNDEMRQLKDFKALISEKTEPKYIRILKRTIWFLMVIMITIAGVILGYRLQQNNEVLEGAHIVFTAFLRPNRMADINFNVRLLQLLSTGQYWARNGLTSYQAELEIKRNISTVVDQLQQLQFDVIKARLQMETRMTQISPQETYPVEFLLQGWNRKKYYNIYNDAVFQYITSASSLENSTQASFNFTDVVMDTQKNFFYVMFNGLRELRFGAEFKGHNYYKFYYSYIQNYQVTFLVIMSAAMFLLVFSQFVLIPIVFQVHKTNNRVMSLFGIIPIQEIKELASKCETYTSKFLEDKNEKRRQEISEPNIKEELIEHKKDKKEDEQVQMYIDNEDQSLNPDSVLRSPQNKEISQIISKLNRSDIQNNSKQININQVQAQKVNNKEFNKDQTKSSKRGDEDRRDEENDLENIRSQKLLNSKDNNRSIILLQFCFFSCLFIAYFIVDIVLEEQYLQKVSTIFTHLKLISLRPSQLKYAVYFTIEQIVTGQNQIFNSTDLSIQYRSLVYQNERLIFNSIQQTYPSQFQGYETLFSKFNYESVCDQKFTIYNRGIDQNECKRVANGLLTKGLRTAIVSVNLATTDLISNYDKKVSDPTFIFGAYQREVVQSIFNDPKEFDSLQYLLKYMGPAIDYLNEKFMDCLQSYMNDWGQVEQIKFVIFLIFMLLVFLACWTPYLNNLSKQIWRTKGMLNMIPMEVIQRYPSLKEAFIGGDILQAVK